MKFAAHRRLPALGLLVGLVGTLAVACARKDRAPRPQSGMNDDNAVISPDTARGIVRRVGADPLSRVALFPVPPRTVAPLELRAAEGAELRAAEGLEVTVSGRLTPDISREVSPGGARVFAVQHFSVRAADGVPAHDGILVSQNGKWFLESAPDARTPIVSLPSALASQAGARVFLVGPLDKAAQSFGVLRAK